MPGCNDDAFYVDHSTVSAATPTMLDYDATAIAAGRGSTLPTTARECERAFFGVSVANRLHSHLETK